MGNDLRIYYGVYTPTPDEIENYDYGYYHDDIYYKYCDNIDSHPAGRHNSVLSDYIGKYESIEDVNNAMRKLCQQCIDNIEDEEIYNALGAFICAIKSYSLPFILSYD